MSEGEVQEHDAEELLEQLSVLVGELEQHPDTEVREKALDLVQIILKLHGEALRRMLTTFESLPMKSEIYSRMLGDEVIRAILTIHDLLPEELETRVATAIEELRPFLISQGCDVKLLGVDNGHARLRLMQGKGAPPVAALKLEIEKVLDLIANDLLVLTARAWPTERSTASLRAVGVDYTPSAGERRPPGSANQKHTPRGGRCERTWFRRSITGFDDGKFKIVITRRSMWSVNSTGSSAYPQRLSAGRGGPLARCSIAPSLYMHGNSYALTRGLLFGKARTASPIFAGES